MMFEFFQTQTPQVAIFGAGHKPGQALTSILSGLPCHVKVIDSRPEWLSPFYRKKEQRRRYMPIRSMRLKH
ncbi:hypothetical protein P4S64_18040 [Vibrio sp. M60_M31a]